MYEPPPLRGFSDFAPPLAMAKQGIFTIFTIVATMEPASMKITAGADSLLEQARAAMAGEEFAAAFASATQVLEGDPLALEARVIRVNAALKLERWQEAIVDLDVLLAAQPRADKLRRSLSLCWLRIGNQHRDQAGLDTAIQAYRKATEIDPHNRDAFYNLGVLLLDTHRVDAAVAALEKVISLAPDDHAARLKLAQAFLSLCDDAAAGVHLDAVAAHATAPEQLQQCAKLMIQAGSIEAAKSLARRILNREDLDGADIREFCRQLRDSGDLDGSREFLGLLRAQTRDPAQILRVDLATALGLPAIYADCEAVASTRANFSRRLDQFTDAYPTARIAAIRPPADVLAWDNFYLAYQGENDRDLQSRFGDWLSGSMDALLPQLAQPLSASGRPKLRLAVVSSRLHQCTVGSYFVAWIEHLARCGWEVVLAHIGPTRDHVTERMARAAHGELNLGVDIVENATKLHALGADLLLYPELGMDFRVLLLAALRLAPRQACAWGHPVTSGLPTIDAFISCAAMEPDGAQEHYRESLLTLPGLGTRYLSPEIPLPSSREACGLPAAGNLYLAPQSLFKLHPDNDDIYVEILQRDSDAVLVFFRGILDGAARVFRKRLEGRLDQAGINDVQRVIYLPMQSRTDYLRINLACDVMLDSLHWSGGNTSLDALHCCLPVVTCPGRFMRGRQSMAMLQQLDCPELIAKSPQELAALAVDVARDRTRRKDLQRRIGANLPALVQSDEALHALDAILRKLVIRA